MRKVRADVLGVQHDIRITKRMSENAYSGCSFRQLLLEALGCPGHQRHDQHCDALLIHQMGCAPVKMIYLDSRRGSDHHRLGGAAYLRFALAALVLSTRKFQVPDRENLTTI